MRLIRLTTILALIIILPACSWFKDNEKVDDTVPAKTLYSRAKKELSGNNWEAAIKQYEALRASYPYGPYAQQAELELAYAYINLADEEKAQENFEAVLITSTNLMM